MFSWLHGDSYVLRHNPIADCEGEKSVPVPVPSGPMPNVLVKMNLN